LRRYAEEPLRRALQGREEFDGDSYNWALGTE